MGLSWVVGIGVFACNDDGVACLALPVSLCYLRGRGRRELLNVNPMSFSPWNEVPNVHTTSGFVQHGILCRIGRELADILRVEVEDAGNQVRYYAVVILVF